jgi:hypothetical protein
MGDLFKHTGFLEPACDGQHGYRVPLVSVVKKNICFWAARTLFPQNSNNPSFNPKYYYIRSKSSLHEQHKIKTAVRIYTNLPIFKTISIKRKRSFCSVIRQHLLNYIVSRQHEMKNWMCYYFSCKAWSFCGHHSPTLTARNQKCLHTKNNNLFLSFKHHGIKILQS